MLMLHRILVDSLSIFKTCKEIKDLVLDKEIYACLILFRKNLKMIILFIIVKRMCVHVYKLLFQKPPL